MVVRILLKSPIVKLLSKDYLGTGIRQSVRNGGHAVSYRSPPPPHSKATSYGAEIVSAAMWWWVFWHLWHEYEHITGEFPYPNPKSWTNQELGIPTTSSE